MIIRDTLWSSRNRINVENELSFANNLARRVEISTKPRFNFGVTGFSICYFVDIIDSVNPQSYSFTITGSGYNIVGSVSSFVNIDLITPDETHKALHTKFNPLKKKQLVVFTFDGTHFKLYGNGLLKNPSYDEQKKLLLHFNCNLELFYDTGSEVKLKNVAPQSEALPSTSPSDYDMTVFGLSGATSADQLTDVANHLKDINELR